MLRCLCLLFLFPSSLFAASSSSLEQISDSFPSKGFEDSIQFWTTIFTHYSEKEVVLHDQDDVLLMYEVVRFDRGVRNDIAEFRRQRQVLRKKEQELQRMFEEIRRYGSSSDKLNEKHLQIVYLLQSRGYSITPTLLRNFGRNIRPQRGIKEHFRESLIRSGKYLSAIEDILQRHGVPQELALLPHIESSFDYDAYSKRGAAGIWQFIRSTGRRFLTISRTVDERLDPLKSTEAAALLLQENYQALGSWPLAVTAFNHGRNGMARAKRRFGDDLGEIIKRYKSRTFGFASKNFYVEFLAAVEVARNYTKYFGPLEISEPMQFDTVVLDRPYHVRHFTQIEEVTESILQEYNPQITQAVWQRSKIFPSGIKLRVPRGKGEAVRVALESAPPAPSPIIVAEDGSIGYRVQYGDTLSDIAVKLGTSTRSLQRTNNIANPHRIYLGQLLLVSGSPERPTQYRVKWGDTLIEIAGRFGVSMRQLQRTNQIDNPHRIYLGQVLLIP